MSIFRGRFEIKLDPKSRLSLPGAFREVLREIDTDTLIITNSQQQGKRCLDAYPEQEWIKLEKKISKLPQLRSEVQAFQRFYLSGGHTVPVDAQSRILVPQTLKTYAGLQTGVVVVGFANKFEIWAQEVWSSLFENLSENFEATMSGIADLVGGEND